jgi:hypothetical protein
MRGQQLSVLSAGSLPAAVGDLAGLLLGPGQLVRMGGTARLSAIVGEQWREAALLAELAARGLAGERVTTVSGEVAVRTPFAAVLRPLAELWVRGAVKAPPPRFGLDGPRVRLWVIGSGRYDTQGYLLRLGRHDPAVWPAAGTALAAVGLAGAFLDGHHGHRADGPAYRITGRRRLARLAELVGDPPPGPSPPDWPG